MSIAWDLASGWTVQQIPSSLPPLFSGDRLVVYGVLKASQNANKSGDNEVRLQAVLEKGEKIGHLIKFSTACMDVENKGNALLHQLAAKSFIQEKQDDHSERHDSGQEFEEDKTAIISISKSANVVSKFTSFVAVDQDSHQPVSGPLSKHSVPLMSMSYCLAGGGLDSASAHSAGRLKKMVLVLVLAVRKSTQESLQARKQSLKDSSPHYLEVQHLTPHYILLFPHVPLIWQPLV